MTQLLTLLAQAEPAPAGGLQGIADGNGVAISITGMLIVFVALTTISVFIAALPKVLTVIEPYFPETAHHHHAAPAPSAGAQPAPQDDGAAIAAIGYALHARQGEGGNQ